MAEDAFVTDFEHIMADDITDDVRFIMYDSASGKTASAGEVSKYMTRNIHVDTTLTEEGSAADAKAVGGALAKKADTKGRYEDIVAGGAEQLMADGHESDSEPYLFRPTGGSADVGNREYLDKIVGGTVAWNQLANPKSGTDVGATFTVVDGVITVNGTTTATSYYPLNTDIKSVADHIYLVIKNQTAQLNGVVIYNDNKGIAVAYNVDSVIQKATGTGKFYMRTSSGVTFNNYKTAPQIHDLTAMFGSTIADYIYSLEQSQAGAGVAWFRRYFPEDYYPYHAVSLESVQATAHKTYDADGNVIGNYALDSSLVLRGVPKLVDGKLAYDGDIYLPSGEVQRRYGLRAYQSGDESLADAITDGANTVYKLTTPTTETADGYEQYQICDPSGTEEFVTTGIVPVGHETRYPHDLKKKIETAPDSPSADGTYLMKRSGGKNTYMALPSTPSANGAYVLTVTVSGGTASYSWTKKE